MVSKKKDIFDDPIRIRFSGLYDYDGMLDMMRSFFFRHRFDLAETKFKYKTGGSGSEVEWVFEGERETTQYVKVYMKLTGRVFDMQRRKVRINGKEEIRTSGRIDVQLTGAWELDWADAFAKLGSKSQKKLEKRMQAILDQDPDGIQFNEVKTIGKKYMQKTLNAFADEIKTFLGMETHK